MNSEVIKSEVGLNRWVVLMQKWATPLAAVITLIMMFILSNWIFDFIKFYDSNPVVTNTFESQMATSLVSKGVVSIKPDGKNHIYQLKNGTTATVGSVETGGLFNEYVLFEISLKDNQNISVKYWGNREQTSEEIVAALEVLTHSVIGSIDALNLDVIGNAQRSNENARTMEYYVNDICLRLDRLENAEPSIVFEQSLQEFRTANCESQ
jgi:hypothetical protein